MAIILLFQNPAIQDTVQNTATFLGDEWLASAVGIAITYFVFTLGIPALVFQTFIDGVLRNIYSERFGNRWLRFFLPQLILITFLFIQSFHKVCEWDDKQGIPEWFVALIVILTVVTILLIGYFSLLNSFKSTRNIEQQLSKKIVDDAISYFQKHGKLNKKDLDDLGILAKELPAGRIKNDFLGQCERFIEHLLETQKKHRDTKLIGQILEDAVCLSVIYDGAKFNNENMRKVLDILILTYSHTHRSGLRESSTSYLNTTIGNCMKEIGIKAMRKNDLASVMDAVEKLSALEAISKEMFILGNEALLEGHVQTAVVVVRKLGGKVRHNIAPGDALDYDDKRTYFFWLGLVAKMHQLGGSARDFAHWQMQNVVTQFGDRRDQIPPLFKETETHFYKLADFDTVDAVRDLQEVLFPE